MSYWCPTVADNTGKPLDQQGRWIRDSARHVDVRPDPLLIDATTVVEPRDFERVHQRLQRVMAERALPVADRLAAAAALVGRLVAAVQAGADGARAVDRVLAEPSSGDVTALAADGRRGGQPGSGRRALSLFLLRDREGGRMAAAARFASVVLFNAGLVRLRSRALDSKANWPQTRRVAFRPSPEADAMLTRYFTSKVESRRYVSGDNTLVTGINTLVTAYGMANLMARLRAASDNRQHCHDEDIREGIRTADLLVVEHTGFSRRAVDRRLVQATLGSPTLAADLLALLGA